MITIKVHTLLTPKSFERLEDALRDFLELEKISATINNEITGNSIWTRPSCRVCGEYIDDTDFARDCCNDCLKERKNPPYRKSKVKVKQ